VTARTLLLSLCFLSATSAMRSESWTAQKDKPIPLYKGDVLGGFSRKITTTSPEAQAFFNQGCQLMFAFDKMGAIRSFRVAEKKDPDCAMCFWGEAWAWGSYLNGHMTGEESPFALAAVREARKRAQSHNSEQEQGLITALAARYVEHFDSDKSRDQDIAYSEAMRKLYERYPNDPDIGTWYGEALFLLEPRRGSRDIYSPNIQRIAQVFEHVLKLNSTHVGTCHLYIHLTEATVEPGRAEACADSIENIMPGASHLNHMPSHTWNQLGRWGDSVRANLEAWHSDQKDEAGQGIAIYPMHDLQMLAFAASMDGQGAIANRAGRDYTLMMHDNIFEVLTLVRFGRFEDILALTDRPKSTMSAGAWDFGQGYANLRTGKKDVARTYLKTLSASAATAKEIYRVNSTHDLLGILSGILEGEIARDDQKPDLALTAFRRAADLEDKLIYDEPETLPFSPRHWLGRELLETKQYGEAEQVYRAELKRHPRNGWSLYGLKIALEQQQKPAKETAAQLEESWRRSDTWLHTSAY
jgi:tetratricopeptide (TPR) repeat protein